MEKDLGMKTDGELTSALNETAAALGKLRFQRANSSLQKSHQMKQSRRDIARIKTEQVRRNQASI